MISIFNGRKRTLGGEESKVFAQVGGTEYPIEARDGTIIIGTALLSELHALKGVRLNVYVACKLFYADGIYPTVADLAGCTGYSRGAVSQAYRQLIGAGYLDTPVCSECGQGAQVEKFHQHHIAPGGCETANICIGCHNKQNPR